MDIEYAIIGTGPSAVAAAAALIDAGLKPTFICAGSTQNGKVLVAKTLKVRGQGAGNSERIGSPGQKAWFGSYDPYIQKFKTMMSIENKLNVRPSNAIGGFSRIWGGTFDFWPEDNRWPTNAKIDYIDYARVKALLPETLVNFEELHIGATQLPAATASRIIYQRLTSKSKRGNVEITPAKLAVETVGSNGCTHCSSCLDGCPNDSIWFSGSQIQKWLNENKANLIEGHFVERINAKRGQNEIHCVDRHGKQKTFLANKIYIAAGAIGTANLVLNSTEMRQIIVKDTSTVFTAGISVNKQPEKEQGHTLSQFWLRWNGEEQISAQVYAPNITNLKRLISRFQILGKLRSLIAPLVLRLHPVIIYLDELKSPTIVVRKTSERIEIFEAPNDDYKNFRKAALAKARKTFRRAGLLIPPIGTDFSPAGTGYHFGASLPMGFLTDNLGRISGWHSVYIVDSSALPYLSVGSITPTVMANAHRIARQTLESKTSK